MATLTAIEEHTPGHADVRFGDVVTLVHATGAKLTGAVVGADGSIALLGGATLDSIGGLGWTVDSLLRSPRFTPGVYGHPDITGPLSLDDLFVATDSEMKHLVTDEDETHAATMDPKWSGLRPLRHPKEIVADTLRAVRLALDTDDPTTHAKLDRVARELGA